MGCWQVVQRPVQHCKTGCSSSTVWGNVRPLLARRLTTAEIAGTLVVSPYTVHDHVKSLFEKVGVSSRQELVARVFLEEYLPEVVQGTPIASNGRFEEA